jgi:hypothetical protein
VTDTLPPLAGLWMVDLELSLNVAIAKSGMDKDDLLVPVWTSLFHGRCSEETFQLGLFFRQTWLRHITHFSLPELV